MGMFSALCEECKHPVLQPAATEVINAWMSQAVAITRDGGIITGQYDGYGRLWDSDGIERDAIGIAPTTVWHRECWLAAGSPRDYRGESENAPDQGWFFDDRAHRMPEPRA